MALRVAGLAIVFAACTWLFGWWCIPIVAAVYPLVRNTSASPVEAGVGAMLAWAALFLINAGAPAFHLLLTRLGGVFPMPGAIVLVIAVLFAGLLAWSAARLVLGIRGFRDPTNRA